MANWTTAADLATAGGTLVLPVATFASVRSANRAARAADRSYLNSLRRLLVPTRPQDPEQKVLFSGGGADQHWVKVGGGRATAEVTDLDLRIYDLARSSEPTSTVELSSTDSTRRRSCDTSSSVPE